MKDWPEYQSHKVVRAARIVWIQRNALNEVVDMRVRPEGATDQESFMPTEQSMANRARLDDWAMLYPDGFKSVSPAKAFSEGYIPLGLMPEEPKTLERAIEHAINKFSAENGSNTPDFILAQFLMGALAAWDGAVKRREEWYGRSIGGLIDTNDPTKVQQ